MAEQKDKALEFLSKKKECLRGYPHICNKHPEDCDNYFEEKDVLKALSIQKEQVKEIIRRWDISKNPNQILMNKIGFEEEVDKKI